MSKKREKSVKNVKELGKNLQKYKNRKKCQKTFKKP